MKIIINHLDLDCLIVFIMDSKTLYYPCFYQPLLTLFSIFLTIDTGSIRPGWPGRTESPRLPSSRYTILSQVCKMAENREEEHDAMDAPEDIDRLEDLALSGREGYVCY